MAFVLSLWNEGGGTRQTSAAFLEVLSSLPPLSSPGFPGLEVVSVFRSLRVSEELSGLPLMRKLGLRGLVGRDRVQCPGS